MIRSLLLLCLVLLLGNQSIVAENKALLIGIGEYDKKTTGWKKIHGNNDVRLLEGKLKIRGYSTSTLLDKAATKANIRKALKSLVASTGKGDTVYLHFSGHGQLVPDFNKDEENGFDQSFVCYDACFSPNYKIAGKPYRGQNHFIDDELFPFLNDLKRKVGKRGMVMVVFDTCYSEGEDRGEQTDRPDPESEVEWSDTTRGTDDRFQVNNAVRTYLRNIKKPVSYTSQGGNIIIISACGRDKKNYECKQRHSGRNYGSLSYCISKILDKNIPMEQWKEFFRVKKYKALKIFRPSQNPVVESH